MRFGSLIVVTLAFGALVASLAPDGPGAPTAGGQAQARADVARKESWQPEEVVLPRNRDGHFYAEVATDSGSVMMLVDTGATSVALTANDAAMMGVDWDPNDVRPVARGASGDVYGAVVMLDRIDVGGIEARGVEAVVVPEGLDVSLLGQSFLARVNKVEVSGDQMVLRD